MSIVVSVIIPARNEAALIAQTVEAALAAVTCLETVLIASTPVAEVIVVDNQSSDGTGALVLPYTWSGQVRLISCRQLGSASARNTGARHAHGSILVFVDADTLIPPESLKRIVHHCTVDRVLAGITRLAPREPGWRARLWWQFWSQIRRLPLARAKAMPALMFCTRETFEQFGPFNEQVSIGEEWPILASIYREHRSSFLYDWELVAHSSSRRMELQPFGYARTLFRYLWAILHHSGRVGYPDTVRHKAPCPQEGSDDNPALRSPIGDRLGSRAAAPATGRDGGADPVAGDGS
jgi:glycosyltransferase involved in cell wall biosynthesis